LPTDCTINILATFHLEKLKVELLPSVSFFHDHQFSKYYVQSIGGLIAGQL